MRIYHNLKKLRISPKITSALSFLIVVNYSLSQRWVNMGATIGLQGNKLLNSQLKSDETLDAKLGFNPRFGLNFNFNTTEFFQISLETSYAKVTNKLSYNTPDTTMGYQGARKIMFSTIDAALIFRYFASSGGYLEAGGKYTLVNHVTDIEKNSLYQVDATNNIQNYSSLILGIGILAFKNNRTNIHFGLRGEYTLTNVISDAGNAINYPTYKNYGTQQSSYKLISGMFVVNLSYDIGILNASRQTYRYPYFDNK